MLEQLSLVFQLALEPFAYLVNPQKRIYWPYLLSGAVMGLVVIYWRSANWRQSLRQVLTPQHWLHPSSRVDVKWLVLNHVLGALLVVPLLGGQLSFAMVVNKTLSAHLGAGNFLAWGVLGTSILFTLAIFIFEDFTRFFVHYLYHKVPLLWRFHAIHHSATVMTPITLYRIHFVEMAINSCRSLLVIGGLSGVFIYVFDSPVALIQVLGVSIFTMIFNLAGANLRHSHAWVGFGRVERWFISPAQHQIHHSTAAEHIDTNYGASLAIWDRWFGSWVASKDETVPGFGLAGKTVDQRLQAQLAGL